MNEHYIDSRFRKELAGLEANPPVEAWLAITDVLDIKRKRNKQLLLLRSAAAIAVLLVTSFSFWFTILNKTTPGNEAQFSQTIPNLMPSTSFELLPASTIPFEKISKKQIDNHQYLFTQTQDYSFAAFYENNSLQSLTPSDKTNLLTISSPSAQLHARPSTSSFHTKHNTPSAQNTFDKTQRNPAASFSLSFYMAPQYNYRYLANKSRSDFRDIPFQSLEKQLYTYSAGISAFISLSPDWQIQTGLNYNNMGQFVDGIVSYQHPEKISLYSNNQYVITSLGGVKIHDEFHHFEDSHSYRVIHTKQTLDETEVKHLNKTTEGITQTFSYLEVPIIFRYNISKQSVGISIKGGVSGNYLLRKDVFLGKDIFQTPIGETYGVKQLNFSVIGGFAMNLPITSNIFLHVEPTAQLFLHPLVLDGFRLGNAVPYNFSLQTGFSYRF